MLGLSDLQKHCIVGKFSVSEFSYLSQSLIKMCHDSVIGYHTVNIQFQYQKESTNCPPDNSYLTYHLPSIHFNPSVLYANENFMRLVIH